MKFLKFLLGFCLGLTILFLPLSQSQVSHLEPLQTLAVQLDGRKKPLDTVARERVIQIHGSTHYRQDSGVSLDYFPTYLSLWFNDRNWNEEKFILFSYRPLKEIAGLDPERKYFSFQELAKSDLSGVFLTAKNKEANGLNLNREEREALTVADRMALVVNIVGNDNLPLVPHPKEKKGKWLGLEEAEAYYQPEQLAPLQEKYQQIKQLYRSNPNPSSELGALGADLEAQLRQLSPNIYPDPGILQQEVDFSALHPFGKAWKLYAIAFLAMLLGVWFEKLDLYWGSMGIFSSGLAIQGYGFLERMTIAGRPPVTNMYESVVWVGFGIGAVALLFELLYRAKYYLLAAAPLAVVSLLLADSLPAILDPSIKPLVPVLRDNFWLSIHVPTITLSYASFGLAMGLGHIILGSYLFAPQGKERIASLSQLNYRVIQVGVLLLTTGVILGGIWAHFAWGRFWGWDPKETWALIALLSYLVPLHGRLVGWLGNFGMGVASVVCFNSVLMAWYGVNFVLGQGLHSYGFGTGGSELIIASLVGVDLLFVLAATVRYKDLFAVSKEEESLAVESPVSQSPQEG